MGHHSDQPFDGPEKMKAEMEKIAARQKLMRDLLDTTGFRGAIGAYPEGKLTPSDEGAIQFAIGESDGKVVIDFGTAVHWLAMSPQDAADMASSLLSKARLVGRRNGETITMTIGG